jgi:mRNA-degrading endonuclease RelE of RelBE toxin-antitoxin system
VNTVVVRVSKAFQKQAKPLLKKYVSLVEELKQLAVDLSINPYLGKKIMPNVFKIRIVIKSKGKGKRGGARVITFHRKETNIIGLLNEEVNEHTITLIAIYDKSDTENITDNEIRKLIQNISY